VIVKSVFLLLWVLKILRGARKIKFHYLDRIIRPKVFFSKLIKSLQKAWRLQKVLIKWPKFQIKTWSDDQKSLIGKMTFDLVTKMALSVLISIVRVILNSILKKVNFPLAKSSMEDTHVQVKGCDEWLLFQFHSVDLFCKKRFRSVFRLFNKLWTFNSC
jgi:hypothetical protein